MTYLYVKESNAGAMDVGTGVFTAPLAGTYQFMLQVYNVSHILLLTHNMTFFYLLIICTCKYVHYDIVTYVK